MSEFLKAYIECALWSSIDDKGLLLEEKYNHKDISDDCLAQMTVDCQAFYDENFELIKADLRRAGHDFWLTRCGHGCGFWDGNWPDEAGEKLTKASKKFGNVDLYIGDDGKIYS